VANLTEVGACTTRLRLNVRDQQAVDDAALKALGARGLIRPSPTALQVVLGPIADVVAVEIRDALAAGGVTVAAVNVVEDTADTPVVLSAATLAALGGAANVRSASVHPGRIRVTLTEAKVDEAALRTLGVRAVARPTDGTLHLLVADAAALTA
jgi:PTS system N-acetylglucosamine-specific IIC component